MVRSWFYAGTLSGLSGFIVLMLSRLVSPSMKDFATKFFISHLTFLLCFCKSALFNISLIFFCPLKHVLYVASGHQIFAISEHLNAKNNKHSSDLQRRIRKRQRFQRSVLLLSFVVTEARLLSCSGRQKCLKIVPSLPRNFVLLKNSLT